MRTLAAKLNDDKNSRYADDNGGHDLDPTLLCDAKKMMSAPGAKKAAAFAIEDLLVQAGKAGQGWLPTATIRAPIRVLMALTTLGVLEMADDNAERQTIALRFRLTEKALDAAAKKGVLK